MAETLIAAMPDRRPQPKRRVPPLQNGDHLSAREFLRRYQAMPEVKKAELVNGIVYMGSPVLQKCRSAGRRSQSLPQEIKRKITIKIRKSQGDLNSTAAEPGKLVVGAKLCWAFRIESMVSRRLPFGS